MASVIVIQLAFFLLAVLQQRTNAAAQSGLILLSCPDTPCPVSTAGPGHSPIRRDDYSYTPGIGGHKFHKRAATWNEARRICVEEGGHLAIINSITEARIINGLFKKPEEIVGDTGGVDWAHIGFHDLYEKGEFVTIHSVSLAKAGYAEWRSGEPSGLSERGEERCGSVNRDGTGLNDIKCTDKVAFICELPIY